MKQLGCHRRQVLGALALAPLGGAATAAESGEPFPDRVTLIVAGPAGGSLDQVARTLASGLQQHLPAGTRLSREAVGGVDGVTGANQFATQTGMDGGSAMLLPGAATLAWLAGDSRVHFDPSRWLPILARSSPAVVLGRSGAAPIKPGQAIRVASGGPISPALAAMLAVDLLGADVVPVYGLGEPAAAAAALQTGAVDVALVRGMMQLAGLIARYPAVRPQFSFGMRDAAGELHRDAEVPEVPTLVEYSTALGRPVPSGPRFEAWCCAASAARLQYALVLPSLTPSSEVALWREAGAQALTPDLATSTDMFYASAASLLLRSLSPGGAALLDLREWLADRLGWQPG
jgi:hypothetical protein